MGNSWSATNVPELKGKTALVTGGNSGIGYITCLELGRAGVEVFVLARSEERGKAAVEAMKTAVPTGKYELVICDVSELKSVREFATSFIARGITLDILINNCGIMMTPTRELTSDGLEGQLATNHLGHFALTGLLLPLLLKSSSPRVVSVSSIMAWKGNFQRGFDFVHETNYDPEKVYGDSKLANLLFMKELGIRYPAIVSVAAHPGGTSTNLQKHAFRNMGWLMQEPVSGALPSLRAAVEPGIPSGTYYGPRMGMWGAPTPAMFPGQAKDPELSRGLWEASVKATKVEW